MPETENQRPEFVRVHNRSGHRTIHVYIPEEGQSKKDEILQRCNDLGCTWEGKDNKMFALDFPTDVAIDPAIEYLKLMKEAELADWRLNYYE
jgi:Rieske Fe-S protein